MDSPTELSAQAMRTFTVTNPDGRAQTIRTAVHHDATDADVDQYAAGVERIVREEMAIFGELPPFEPGTYTFLADYVPWGGGDGMEHRNSTVVADPVSIKGNATGVLETVAHEFFHCWNVERIRPRSLEPFNFEHANMSGELWLAEGFTQYYGDLVLHRAGFVPLARAVDTMGDYADAGTQRPRPRGAFGDRDERAGALHRRRDGDRSHQLEQHLHLGTTPTAPRSRWPWI